MTLEQATRPPALHPQHGGVSRGETITQLEELGETIKAQQALVRSCGARESTPELRAQLDVLLRLLTDLRRQQRTLARLWRTVPAGALVPHELVADTDLLLRTHLGLEAPLARCRDVVLQRQREESLEAWQEVAQLAQRRLAHDVGSSRLVPRHGPSRWNDAAEHADA